EDDTISGIDGRSDKGAERDNSVLGNVGIFKDRLSEDIGTPVIDEEEGGSDSIDVFADGLVSEEDVLGRDELIVW
ncbi:hypothetical protein KI387_008374, partial [Taxus chinensis]